LSIGRNFLPKKSAQKRNRIQGESGFF
jgi:hypothetical protein